MVMLKVRRFINQVRLLVAGVIACMFTSAFAQSDCGFTISRFEIGSGALGTDYDVFNSVGLVSDILIELTRDAHAAASTVAPEVDNTSVNQCSPRLTISHAGSLSQAGELLNYTLVSRDAKQDPSSSAFTLNDSAYLPGEQRLYQIDVGFKAYQFVEAGEYTGEFAVSVVSEESGLQGDVDSLAVDDTATRLLSVSVPGTARLSLAGTVQRRQIVDFGILEADKRPEIPVSLTIQSTASYQLRIRSENGGQLIRQGGRTNDGIEYETLVNNRLIKLDAGSEAIISRLRTGETGDSIPLSFRIVDVRGKPAGEYADRVTISVVPAISEF